MIIEPAEFLKFIDEAKTVIIYGDTKGRQQARYILDASWEPKVVLDTRRYSRYEYRFNEKGTLIYDLFDYTHVGNILTEKTKCKKFRNFIKTIKKRRPIIVDSYTDIYRLVRNTNIDADENYALNWKLVELTMKEILKQLKKYNRKVVLFVDAKADVLKSSSIKMEMDVFWKTTLDVNGIIRFKCFDEGGYEIHLEKDRIGFGTDLLKNFYAKSGGVQVK